MPARLTVHFPSSPARVIILPDGCETVVGRDPDCGVVLADDRVSRHHAVFAANGSGWSLTDLASKNGTVLDGLPVESGSLKEKSWISFGGLIARFEILQGSADQEEEERRRRFTTSLGMQRGLDPGRGLQELLDHVVTSTLELTNAERGFLLLASPEGGFEVAARSGLSWEDLEADEFGGSLGAVRRALATGASVVSTDTRADAELGGRASVVATGIRALLCVPVRALDRVIGALYADSRRPGAAFTELDLEILEALAAQAGLAIAVARLHEELAALSRRIAETPDAAPGLRTRLAREVSAVLERSLPEARPASCRQETRPDAVSSHGAPWMGP
ncbi:MAG TPA: GAF domain-containing protein [Thermoanaerobaculia bacterium]|nr:GAF domain-containing protein [Thermoanaerobaculia bacterium]